MKRIAITGASGMIGSTLAEVAVENGVEVLALVRENDDLIENLPSGNMVKIVECDMSRFGDFDVAGERCDVLYHFAWAKTHGSSRDDVFSQMDNIKYTLDAVRLAARLGCKAFVGAGSQAEYGKNSRGDISPSLPVDPQTGYGIAKYTSGKLSGLLCGQLGLRHNWCRILSVYGPKDNPFTLTMYCINAMLKGEHVSLTKCDQVWDYIYSKDVARAFFAVGKSGVDKQVYCIGSGDTITLKEFVCKIKDKIDPDINIGFGEKEYNPDQVMNMRADISALTNDTGFTPEVDIDKGIQNTIDWCKERI